MNFPFAPFLSYLRNDGDPHRDGGGGYYAIQKRGYVSVDDANGAQHHEVNLLQKVTKAQLTVFYNIASNQCKVRNFICKILFFSKKATFTLQLQVAKKLDYLKWQDI